MFRVLPLLAALAAAPLLGGCAIFPFAAFLSPEDCMTRVMYFESNRSSPEGMLAVGTVVMNRVADPKFPHTVCGVVGQANQFAPGVLWTPMHEGRSQAMARTMARRVLHGERHPDVGSAEYFHTEGYSFPYTNMHYVAVAGGNAFYWKS
ncbi:MAG TPA: cell wall hydrolase [Devosia sp.]|nr:cell wall hydrolase [Devosia sp.]